MGAGTTLAVVMVILIMIAILYSTFQPVFAGLIDKGTGFFSATQLKPRVTEDEVICDLRVKVFADLEVRGLLLNDVYVKIDPEHSHQYNYFECATVSQYAPLNLLDLDKRYTDFLHQLDIVVLGGETVHLQIVLRDTKDPTQKVDAYTQPQLLREIKISEGAGLVPTPFGLDTEFVVKNIPLRNYDLEIYAGKKINNLEFGQPFVTKICDQFSRLESGTCIRVR